MTGRSIGGWTMVALDAGTSVEQRGHRSIIPEHLVAAVHRKDGEPRPDIEMVSVIDGRFPCAFCGQTPWFDFDGTQIVSQTECPHPDGLLVVTEIDVASGRMVLADDLRPAYDVDTVGTDHRRPDFCSSAGRVEHSTAMAEAGCAYGPTTNTKVTLYRTAPDRYAIAVPDWAVAESAGEHVADAMLGEALGQISCDVWAYAAADHDAWAARLAALDPGVREDSREPDITVIDVTPGRYRFTCYTMVRDFEPYGSGVTVFATFERVPDRPVGVAVGPTSDTPVRP